MKQCITCKKSIKNWRKYCSTYCYSQKIHIRFSGKNNPMWKGDKVGFKCLHKWVYRHKGRPGDCSFCGEGLKKRVWANKSRKYLRDLSDWIPLCYSCHYKYDEKTWWKQSIRGRVPWNKGVPCSEETKKKIGQKAKGRKHSDEAKKKMLGRIPWNKGLKLNEESFISCNK